LSPKRENKPDKPKNNSIHSYLPVFSPDFKADLAWWYRNEPKKGDKILDLVSLDAFKFPTRIPIYKAFQDIKVQCKCV